MTTTTSPAPATDQPQRPRRRLDRRARGQVTVVVALAAAAGGAAAGAHPTDLWLADLLWSAALAGGVTWFSAYARRWSWSWMAGVAAVVSAGQPALFIVAVVALALAVWSVRHRRRLRIAGAIIGALAMQPLLRIDDLGATGVPTLIVAVAVLPVLVSGYHQMPGPYRRRIRRGSVVAAGVLVAVSVLAGVAALLVAGRMRDAVASSRAAVTSAGDADEKGLEADLDRAESGFSSSRSIMGSPVLLPARALPIVGPHVGALLDVAEIGRDLSVSAQQNLDRLDYDRLRYRKGQIDLEQVEVVSVRLAEVRGELRGAEVRAADLDSPWLLSPLTSRVGELERNLVDTIEQADVAQRAVDLAPSMLGGDGKRRYLVAFPTPAEMRGGGGFVGNYVILEARDGRVTLAESRRIDTLRPTTADRRTLTGLDEYVSRYGRFNPTDLPQDTFLSPHAPWNAEAFIQITEQAGEEPFDGLISLTPAGLASLLRLTGPVPVPGRDAPLGPDDARQFLLHDQYLEFEDPEVRADALEALTRTTFDRLVSGSLPTPRELGDVFGPLVPTGDLQMFATRDSEQRDLAEFDVTGSFPRAGGHDLVHVSAINGGNSKIDVFLQRTITVEPRRDPSTGEISSRVTVRLKNSAPDSGLPRYVIGNAQGLPNGTNRMLLSLFTPLRLDRATIDGEQVGMSAGEERGYRVYERYLEVGPGETAVVVYDLRGFVPGMARYRLLVPAQTMVNPDKLVIEGGLVGRRRALTLDRTRTVTGH